MSDKTPKTSAQDALVGMLMSYDNSPAKADDILSTQFILPYKDRTFRRLCQFIFLNVLRRRALIDKVFADLCRRRPAPKLYAILLAAAAEILSSDDSKLPKIVDFWVEFVKKRCSIKESAFANAVLRKFSVEAKKFVEEAKSVEEIAAVYSHPAWLVGRWMSRFGSEKCIELLKNSQKPSDVFFRVSPTLSAREEFEKCSRFFDKVDSLPDGADDIFYRLKNGHWADVEHLLDSSDFYVQDPSTWLAASMLSPSDGGQWLDLCAAPGGKSRAIADILRSKSRRDELRRTLLVSADFGASRMRLLRENMDKVHFIKCRTIECDLLNSSLSAKLEKDGLPLLFDGVFLDAPCSNTGVLRRRPDARYRIEESDISKCAAIQKKLLSTASEFVARGGKLVYSTCSIEPEENGDIVGDFLQSHPDFVMEKERLLMPSEHNDGAGHCLLRRK